MSRPFGLENQLGGSQSLCDERCSGGFAAGLFRLWQHSNHDVRNSFCHSDNFLFFNSFDDTICSSDLQGLVPNTYCRPTVLFLLTFCSPDECNAKNLRLRHSSDWRGSRYVRQFDWFCPLNSYQSRSSSEAAKQRIAVSVILLFTGPP